MKIYLKFFNLPMVIFFVCLLYLELFIKVYLSNILGEKIKTNPNYNKTMTGLIIFYIGFGFHFIYSQSLKLNTSLNLKIRI